jgi:hypothetical protein
LNTQSEPAGIRELVNIHFCPQNEEFLHIANIYLKLFFVDWFLLAAAMSPAVLMIGFKTHALIINQCMRFETRERASTGNHEI